MLRFRVGSAEVRLSVWFFSAVCVWAVIGGERVALAALFLLAHELGHLAAMAAVGQRVAAVNVLAGRFEIVPRSSLARRRDEVLVLCAGVAVNLALAGVLALAGEPALCAQNLAFAAFNALPAGDLDGGRLLRLLLCGRLRERTAAIVHGTLSFAVSVLVMGVGFLVLLQNSLNLSVLLVGLYIFVAAVQNIRYTR